MAGDESQLVGGLIEEAPEEARLEVPADHPVVHRLDAPKASLEEELLGILVLQLAELGPTRADYGSYRSGVSVGSQSEDG